MDINFVRVDDRLIHGQVATVWVKESKCNKIIICS
ncbi:PTS sugar transporter subunit IIB, partial [Clostridium sp.]